MPPSGCDQLGNHTAMDTPPCPTGFCSAASNLARRRRAHGAISTHNTWREVEGGDRNDQVVAGRAREQAADAACSELQLQMAAWDAECRGLRAALEQAPTPFAPRPP